MKIPKLVIANADDFGLNPNVNKAILYAYRQGYINSTSLLTNTVYFDETVQLIQKNPIVTNIGIHVDFAEGKPISNFNQPFYLNKSGNWDIERTNKKLARLNAHAQAAFTSEINAQIEKALSAQITITHLDSHFHLHTLPCFYQLFLQAAKRYGLKLRLAQTDNEGSYLKFLYRKYINHLFKKNRVHYSGYFETVAHYLQNTDSFKRTGLVEVMLHPVFDSNGLLTDHYDAATMERWIKFLDKSKF
jgi:predicted glycoside hydrolase/deacetylase ChbG (UPF0249 family)